MCLKIFLNKIIPELPIPVLPVNEAETIELTRQSFVNTMKSFGVESLTGATPMDSVVRLASKSELDRIAPFLVYPAEWYTETLWDCENYGMQAANDAGRKFEITVCLGLGNTELGYHGFAITLDRDLNLWILEPNSGFEWAGRWFKANSPQEGNYLPDKVFI